MHTFWDLVQTGLKIFFYWEIYLAVIVYQLISYYIPMIIAGTILKYGGYWIDKITSTVGLIRMIRKGRIIPFSTEVGTLPLLSIASLEATAIFIFTLTILPIVLGVSDDAIWLMPFHILTADTVFFLFCLTCMLFASLVLLYLPLIGRFYSLHVFIASFITAMLCVSNPETASPYLLTLKGSIDYLNHVDFYPYMYLIGFYLVGVLIFFGGMAVLSITAAIFTGISREDMEEIILSTPLMPIFQFVPLYLYGAWLGDQII